MLAGSLGSTAGVFSGTRSARASTAQRRHAVRQAATCQASAEKFTVAITGASLLSQYHNYLGCSTGDTPCGSNTGSRRSTFCCKLLPSCS